MRIPSVGLLNKSLGRKQFKRRRVPSSDKFPRARSGTITVCIEHEHRLIVQYNGQTLYHRRLPMTQCTSHYFAPRRIRWHDAHRSRGALVWKKKPVASKRGPCQGQDVSLPSNVLCLVDVLLQVPGAIHPWFLFRQTCALRAFRCQTGSIGGCFAQL